MTTTKTEMSTASSSAVSALSTAISNQLSALVDNRQAALDGVQSSLASSISGQVLTLTQGLATKLDASAFDGTMRQSLQTLLGENNNMISSRISGNKKKTLD